MIFGKGISKAGDLLDVAAVQGIVTRAGTYFNYGEVRLGQGRDNARTFLEQNPTILAEIDAKVREKVRVDKMANAVVSTNEAEPE